MNAVIDDIYMKKFSLAKWIKED